MRKTLLTDTSLAGGGPPLRVVVSPLLSAKDAAREAGLSVPAFWKAVSSGRLPRPVYPAPKAPRWYRAELHAAIEATRALPCEAKAARRAVRLASAAAARAQG